MAIIRSFGALQSLVAPKTASYAAPPLSVNLYGSSADYAAIYRTQPNVRTVVDFLARNIAQLGVHVFRRISDTDRARLFDHDVARWLSRPNPSTTRYRLIETLVADYAIYFRAFWLKIRPGGELGLVRLPPDKMQVEGALQPTSFVWTLPNGDTREFDPAEIVYFDGYNPCTDTGLGGISPLETLRRVLAEEAAAGEYREAFWRNGARVSGVIERAKDAPSAKWNPEQEQQWREGWQAAYGGFGARTGATALLPVGATFKETTQTAKDAEYLNARKLTREECAAAYHVPLPMVGILEHATFSNIKEQHKHLYQDCLGPWLVMIEEELERQLLPEARDTRDVYIEFNIAEKLKGSFEEQASSLVALTGKPIMKVNEARARLNLPRDEDPESDKIAPQQGGPATATQPDPADDVADDGAPMRQDETDDANATADLTPVIRATRDRQYARYAKLPIEDRPAAFAGDLDRWHRELAADLAKLTDSPDERALAETINAETLRQFEHDALESRVTQLERRPRIVATEREYVRDPQNGLVTKHIDRPIEDAAVWR